MVFNLLIIAVIVLLDQISKLWVLEYLKPVGSIPLLDGVFHLTYAQNFGAAFSIFEGRRWFFVILTIVMIIVLIAWIYIKRRDIHILCRISLVMIIGGALGNLFDRIRLGYVVDMLDFRLINYPIFNIADCFVVVGTALLCYYILIIDGKKNMGGV